MNVYSRAGNNRFESIQQSELNRIAAEFEQFTINSNDMYCLIYAAPCLVFIINIYKILTNFTVFVA